MKNRIDRRKLLQLGTVAAAFGMASVPVSAADHAANPVVKLTWIGASTMVIEFNGQTILTDPCFGEGDEAFIMGDPNEMFDLAKGPNVKAHRRITPFPGITSTDVDLVILSHAHEDHFDQKAEAALKRDISIILPPQDTKKIAEKGFTNLDSLDWGQKRAFSVGTGEIKITAVNTHHSENPEIAKILGKGNGYWLEFSQGNWKKTIYWTGDTFASNDVIKTVQALGTPDIMVPHLGAVGSTGPLGEITMGASDLVPFAKSIKPGKILPIHHSTYELYLEPISELVGLNKDQSMAIDLVSEGTTVLYS